ncbi:MAG: hypothetical protein KatS3mg110_0646 [Pirellulaceae bacterium]|nr:MAG: hypothetical protein KatS3mg110_0646 [Pirellulaceae bacterium]
MRFGTRFAAVIRVPAAPLVLGLIVSAGCEGYLRSPVVTDGVASFSDRSSSGVETVIDLGVVRVGESGMRRVWLENPHPHVVRISRFRTSCDCVRVAVGNTEIPVGGRTLAEVVVSMDELEKFRGALRIDVSLEDDRGKQVLALPVQLEVIGKEQQRDLTELLRHVGRDLPQ